MELPQYQGGVTHPEAAKAKTSGTPPPPRASQEVHVSFFLGQCPREKNGPSRPSKPTKLTKTDPNTKAERPNRPKPNQHRPKSRPSQAGSSRAASRRPPRRWSRAPWPRSGPSRSTAPPCGGAAACEAERVGEGPIRTRYQPDIRQSVGNRAAENGEIGECNGVLRLELLRPRLCVLRIKGPQTNGWCPVGFPFNPTKGCHKKETPPSVFFIAQS